MSMWKTYAGVPIEGHLSDAVDAALLKLRSEGRPVKLCIGTDSQVKGNYFDMATVIVFYVIGNGGFMFVNKTPRIKLVSMKERIMTEVSASIQTAYEISDVARKHQVEIEIHADINADPRFPSHQTYSDAMGYTKGMGYIFKSKPDAFASSVCADRLCQ